jgi:hypothetical protein
MPHGCAARIGRHDLAAEPAGRTKVLSAAQPAKKAVIPAKAGMMDYSR